MKRLHKTYIKKTLAVCGAPLVYSLIMAFNFWGRFNYTKAILWSGATVITLPLLPFAIVYTLLEGNLDHVFRQ